MFVGLFPRAMYLLRHSRRDSKRFMPNYTFVIEVATMLLFLCSPPFSFLCSLQKEHTSHVPEYRNVEIAESGNWIIEPFNDENNSYLVAIDDCKMIECSCYYYKRHQRSCKHLYLLDIHVNEFSILRNSTGISMLTYQTQGVPPLHEQWTV